MKTNLLKGQCWVSEDRGVRRAVAVRVVVLAFAVFGERALPEGLRNPPPGTFDLGRAGGRVADVDDASAAYQNPANLVDLGQMALEVTPSIVYIGVDFASPTGQSAHTVHPWKLLPNGFGSIPLLDGRAAFGIGLTVPYGISNEWDQNSSGFAPRTGVLRYQAAYYDELTTINLSPSLSYKISDSVRIGAGFDVMWSQLTLKQFYPWFAFPGSVGTEPDGHLEGKGRGFGFGGNVGLTWLITDRQRVAVTYRSPMTVHYAGDFTLDNITPTAAALGATAESDFNTKISFPTIVSAGYALQVSDKVRLEADFEWLEWSRFKSLNLAVGNNVFLLPNTSIPQNWKDTFTAGIAGDWRIDEHWIVRAGYQFYQSPIPDSTFSPAIPDSDQNVITVGVGYHYKRSFFEAAYGLDFYHPRHVSDNQNPAFNGNYEFHVHLFSVAYHLVF